MKLNFEAVVDQELERKRAEEEGEEEVLEITLGSNVPGRHDPDASARVYHQKRPEPALMSLVMAGITSNTSEPEKAEALWSFYKGTLPANEFHDLRDRVIRNQDLDLDRLLEVVEKSIAAWSTFPTRPSSDSSGSPTPGGRRSTGRAPGAGSSRSS